jgi:hypothetical protein
MHARAILIAALLVATFATAWVFVGTPERPAQPSPQRTKADDEAEGQGPPAALLEGEGRDAVVEIEQAPRTKTKPRPPVVRPDVEPRDLVVEASNKVTRVPNGTVLGDVHVLPGAQLRLPDLGTVFIEGDLRNEGTIDAVRTDVHLDGRDQTIEGQLAARRIKLSGGLKRVRGTLSTRIGRQNDDPKDPELVVGPGATLLVDGKGSRAQTSDAYGFRIEGHLIIDGGIFQCSFANGNGKTAAQSWPEGSRLTIYKGHFIGRGDHHFGQATIDLHDGRIDIADDLWSLGSQFTMYGGAINNSQNGGMFAIEGRVDVHGGVWRVHQRGDRGLQFRASSDARFNGGQIILGGQHVSGNRGGILVTGAVHLWDLHLDRSTQIDPRSPGGASLTIAHELTSQKNALLRDNGYAVEIAHEIVPQGRSIPSDPDNVPSIGGRAASPPRSSRSPGVGGQPVRPPEVPVPREPGRR